MLNCSYCVGVKVGSLCGANQRKCPVMLVVVCSCRSGQLGSAAGRTQEFSDVGRVSAALATEAIMRLATFSILLERLESN